MKVEINVGKVVQAINKYAVQVAEAGPKSAQAMCERGKEIAERTYAFMEYAGEPITADVNVIPTSTGCDLVASGKGLLFGEFGTGVRTPDHPMQHLVFARGTYGKGRGANPPWFYKGPPGNAGFVPRDKAKAEKGVSGTWGTNATPGMYNASQTIREERNKIFKEVLNNG